MKTALRIARAPLVPRGFRFSGVAAGLKGGGKLDLALAEAPEKASAAAVFTSNRVVAAPLRVGRRHLRASHGRLRTVLVNSGNANCATRGAHAACLRACRELARHLRIPAAQVFPSSTGVIGVALPVGLIERALPRLLRQRQAAAAGVKRFARAILTTDTRMKLAAVRFRCGSGSATLLGVAKGAGMIHPRLAPAGATGKRPHATMLAYLFTDVAAAPEALQRWLAAACARSFNRISVDGDTSTNDTVLLLASGAGGGHLRRAADRKRFAAALEAVCASLAAQIVADGEGVRHRVRLRVEGARTEKEAEQVARSIARSPLVKTAWAGADPNWGRVLAAVGASGAPVDPGRVDLFLGELPVCLRGAACPFDERAAHRYLSQSDYEIRVRLGRGSAGVTFLTGDLTADYVRINARYRT